MASLVKTIGSKSDPEYLAGGNSNEKKGAIFKNQTALSPLLATLVPSTSKHSGR
jgi:hypothetical protein